jgi:hypothetical protein
MHDAITAATGSGLYKHHCTQPWTFYKEQAIFARFSFRHTEKEEVADSLNKRWVWESEAHRLVEAVNNNIPLYESLSSSSNSATHFSARRHRPYSRQVAARKSIITNEENN